jgi:DNA polymerase-1
MLSQLSYREIWCVDFEFAADDGERPAPVCMVAHELRSRRLIWLWRDELQACVLPPFETDADRLFVAYFASAELGCFLALGWAIPARILDLYVEFRAQRNGLSVPAGKGLLGALTAQGLDSMAGDEKTTMRDLIIAGGPWTDTERADILDYCQSDVDALAQLLPATPPDILARPPSPHLPLGHALTRGRYMGAVAHMEFMGVPIDALTLDRLRESWDSIRERLIERVDANFNVYENGLFRLVRFEAYVTRHGIPWPRLETGTLDLARDTFRQEAKAHPEIAALSELRHALSELRLQSLAVCGDARIHRAQSA